MSNKIRVLALLASASLLGACEMTPEMRAEASVEPVAQAAAAVSAPVIAASAQRANFSAHDFQWFSLLAAPSGPSPRPVRNLSDEEIRQSLERVVGSSCPNARACANMVNARLNAPGAPNPGGRLTGVGATRIASFAAAVDRSASGVDALVGVKGQIQTNCLDANGAPQGNREGYSYDSGTQDLRICVVVRTTVEVGGVKSSTFEYFEVEAAGAAFERSCVGRWNDTECAGSSDQNVFPQAAIATGLEIPIAKTMPVPNVVLDHKLYAGGAGIAVRRYGLIKDMEWGGSTAPTPTWTNQNLWDRWQGQGQMTNMLRKIFARSDAACVDMMFVGAPPATLALDQRVIYCLGRCRNPAILNTL